MRAAAAGGRGAWLASKHLKMGPPYLIDEIIPLRDNVAKRTSVVRLAERHSTVHAPTRRQRQNQIENISKVASLQRH